jgi:hypothetical protein
MLSEKLAHSICPCLRYCTVINYGHDAKRLELRNHFLGLSVARVDLQRLLEVPQRAWHIAVLHAHPTLSEDFIKGQKVGVG